MTLIMGMRDADKLREQSSSVDDAVMAVILLDFLQLTYINLLFGAFLQELSYLCKNILMRGAK